MFTNEPDNAITDVCVNPTIRRPSLMEIIKEKQNDQDFNQKVGVASTLLLELYRVLMGAFLMVFVPQNCGDSICSMDENMNSLYSLDCIL